MITRLFLYLFLGVYVIPTIVLAFAHVHGQSTSTVPELSPNPNLQFLPQRAYIITQTPGGQVVSAVPVQNDNDLAAAATGIIGILSGIATGVWAKLSGSKDVKQTNAALLNTKEVTKELARVMFNFQPEQSKALSDAPAIRLQTLEDDKKEFADKVAKS